MGYFYILLAVLVWGLEYILIKLSVMKMSPFLAGILMFLSGGVMLLLHLLFTRRLNWTRVHDNIRGLLLVGTVGAGINTLLLTGVRLTTAANASFLGKTDVLFSLFLSAMIFREKIKKNARFFAPVMLAGIYLLTAKDGLQIGQIGDVFILASAFLLALNAFFIKRVVPHTGALLLGMMNCFVNTVVFSIFHILFGDAYVQASLSLRTASILVGGGMCVYFFFIGYYRALKTLPVWEVRLLMLGVPVVTALLARGFLGETVSVRELAGMVLILFGAAGILVSSLFDKGCSESVICC